MGSRLLKRVGGALAAVVPKAPSPFAVHRAAAVQAVADDQAKWLAAVQAAAAGIEPDAAAVADLVAIAQRLGLANVESEFSGDVQRLRQLRDAEKQLEGMQPARSGELVAAEIKAVATKLASLHHEQQRLSAMIQGRGALLREIEALRGGLPARLKGGAR